MFDDQFPRSVYHCLTTCRASLRAVAKPDGPPTEADHQLAELLAWLDSREIPDLVRAGLHESLTHVVDSTHRLGDAVTNTYFAVELQPPEGRGSGI
jgi:uncharacterized alpha-E superfamily protein